LITQNSCNSSKHSPFALKAILFSLFILFYKKVIYTRHGEDSFDCISWKLVHKFASMVISHVTFVSEKGKDVFRRVQKLSYLPHHVIENGVNTQNINIIKAENKPILRIGSVGRMVKLKHQISLLRALVQLNDSKIEVHFYGDGECLEELQEFCVIKQLNQSVFFHGVVTDRNVIYNSIDVLAVTSETEGLSLAIIEAMAYACPVLATSVGGNPRLVLSGETGYQFNYDDDKKLSELIEKLATDNMLLEELGRKAKQHVDNNFSLEVAADRYLELYT